MQICQRGCNALSLVLLPPSDVTSVAGTDASNAQVDPKANGATASRKGCRRPAEPRRVVSRRDVVRGLSRMRRKSHVRFLGGGRGAIPSCYPAREVLVEASAAVIDPSPRSGRAVGAVFGALGWGFSGAAGVCLGGWSMARLRLGGPHLPPEAPLYEWHSALAPLYEWFSAFGLPAGAACLTLGVIWLCARRAWLARRHGTALGSCGLGVAVFVVVIGLLWWFGGIP